MVKIEEKKLYELGYHLAPYLPAEDIAKSVEQIIKSPIASLGGEITSELNPVLTRLAYIVTKVINNKHTKFSDAYFGAIRFYLPLGVAPKLEEILLKDDLVIRHLLVSLSDGSEAMSAPKRSFTPRTEEVKFNIERVLPEKEEEKPALTTEELDQEIDKLVVDSAE
jgi:ribosomal protein S6